MQQGPRVGSTLNAIDRRPKAPPRQDQRPSIPPTTTPSVNQTARGTRRATAITPAAAAAITMPGQGGIEAFRQHRERTGDERAGGRRVSPAACPGSWRARIQANIGRTAPTPEGARPRRRPTRPAAGPETPLTSGADPRSAIAARHSARRGIGPAEPILARAIPPRPHYRPRGGPIEDAEPISGDATMYPERVISPHSELPRNFETRPHTRHARFIGR